MQLKWGVNIIYICLQENKYVHWVNEWYFNIYRESWTPFITFQTKQTPENTFILFIFHVRKFLRGGKRANFTANDALTSFQWTWKYKITVLKQMKYTYV